MAPVLFDVVEEALAAEFVRQHEADLRYCAEWGRWVHWDGARWKHERTLLAFDLARKVCKQACAFVSKRHEVERLSKAATVAAVEKLAKAYRAMATVSDQFDNHPMLLNTPGGTVDLTTGELRPHDRLEYHSKVTAVTPAETVECPMFLEFMDWATGGDLELLAYLQRLLGYALTGSTREHSIDFWYGPGGNGKGTLLNTVAGIMGDYVAVAASTTFMETRFEQHTTELAMLRGARLVIAQEVEQDKHWAEARIKSLTGGDPITARYTHKDNFTFIPQFTLIIAGNHKPKLRTVDDAIRRRLRLIPFLMTVPAGEVDEQLKEKLQAEWPGILRWAIEGCLKWQNGGLQPPASVFEATEEYLEAEDIFSMWRAECLVEDPRARTKADDIWKSWRTWAEQAGERPGSRKAFSQELKKHGYETDKQKDGGRNSTLGYRGLKLRDPLQDLKDVAEKVGS